MYAYEVAEGGGGGALDFCLDWGRGVSPRAPKRRATDWTDQDKA